MRILSLTAVAVLHAAALGQPTFSVTFDKTVRADPATGRLILYLARDGAKGAPADGPNWDDPQPMYGVNVSNLAPGSAAVVDDTATSFPVKLSGLPAGKYRVQAVLDLHRANSEWKREEGNLFSEPQSITIPASGTPAKFDVVLARAVGPRRLPRAPGLEWFELRSKLLSDFHKRDVFLRAGVVLPAGYDAGAARKYAAVYEVPGFGGDHLGAAGQVRRGRSGDSTPTARLAANTFWIVLDPESGNGHTLFADSANNGPWGRAVTTELIPALEAKYKLAPEPMARLLRGHSSGGWSTLWLALAYPETFGATWSTSPDPVDFHRFQLPDIYDQPSMYVSSSGQDIPSMREGGKPTMSIRTENRIEEVLGPDNTSGQQWDSWLAVFGPKSASGNPAALYDPATGAIDKAIAEQYKKYDITELVRAEPGRYGLPLLQRCRVIVGDQDTYYLNEAVELLKAQAGKVSFLQFPEGQNGYIKILPGYDHGNIFGSPELRAIPDEMLAHLRNHNLIVEPK